MNPVSSNGSGGGGGGGGGAVTEDGDDDHWMTTMAQQSMFGGEDAAADASNSEVGEHEAMADSYFNAYFEESDSYVFKQNNIFDILAFVNSMSDANPMKRVLASLCPLLHGTPVVEREFNYLKLCITPLRQELKTEIVSDMLMLRSNKQLLDKEALIHEIMANKSRKRKAPGTAEAK